MILETWLGPGGALTLPAWLAGHFVADFVLQTRRMAERKRTIGGLLHHGLFVFAAHVLFLVPFLSVRLVAAAALVTVVHLVVDRLKVAHAARRGETLRAFAVDQGAHLLTLVVMARWAGPTVIERTPALTEALHDVFIHTAAVAFLAVGGAAVVRLVLAAGIAWRPPQDGTNAGRAIGILERLLVYVFAVIGQWGAVALVFAAKSIARFDDLKDRSFAEYYLVGTLASLLTAVLVAVGVHILA